MNRDSTAYREAVQRVKISFFTEQLGLDIRDILHVGTNDGYEMQFYRAMGIEALAGVEPNPDAIQRFKASYPDIPLFKCALALVPGHADLIIPESIANPPGDGQGSSLLEELNPNPDYRYERRQSVELRRGDSLPIDWERFDCLVVDVQGFELPVLAGFYKRLAGFRMINVECSREPIYKSGASAEQVERCLSLEGFERKSPIEAHDDVFYVRRS